MPLVTGKLNLRTAILLALIVAALASSLLAVLLGEQKWGALLLNLGTELFGAVMIYVLLELIVGRRERFESRKKDLIAQMGSSVKDVAVAAAEELRRHSFLTDGSLHRAHLSGANLMQANLSGAMLDGADLQGARLVEANLQAAHLDGGNLQEGDLWGANLQGASLDGANLQGAYLWGVNLQGANLRGTNLQRADLSLADLTGAIVDLDQLTQAESLEGATMPDGTEYRRSRKAIEQTRYLLTTSEFGQAIGVSPAKVRSLIHDGLISAQKHRSRWYIPTDEMERFTKIRYAMQGTSHAGPRH